MDKLINVGHREALEVLNKLRVDFIGKTMASATSMEKADITSIDQVHEIATGMKGSLTQLLAIELVEEFLACHKVEFNKFLDGRGIYDEEE